MKIFFRFPLMSIAALAAYLAVNVGAGAIHHHHGPRNRAELPAACQTSLEPQTVSSAQDDDDEENCLLCSVLHLAQILPILLHVETSAALTGEAFDLTSISQPFPLETATHARAPPVA